MAIEIGLAKYFPETLVEALVPTLTAEAETTIASYARFKPKILTLTGIAGEQTDNVMLRVSRDLDANWLDLNAGSLLGLDKDEVVEVPALQTLVVKAYYTAEISYAIRLRMQIDKPTVAEKILRKITLKAQAPAGEPSEVALAQKYNLHDLVATGKLPKPLPNPKIIDVKTISVIVDASTSGEGAAVGAPITVKTGEFVALTEVSVTRTANLAVRVQRDEDTSYLDLDANALPSLTQAEALWCPCVDKLIVTAYGTATGCHIRYRYAICKLDLLRKVLWELPLTDAEEVVAREQDLKNKARAGVWWNA